jgi:hypothetical protein
VNVKLRCVQDIAPGAEYIKPGCMRID